MGKAGAVGEGVNGALGLIFAFVVGAFGVAVIAGASSQGKTVGVVVGLAMTLWAAYRAVNVVFWTKQDINKQLK